MVKYAATLLSSRNIFNLDHGLDKRNGKTWAVAGVGVTDVEREVDCLHYHDSYDDSEHDNSYTTVAIVTVDHDHGDDSWTTTSPDPATAHGSISYILSHEYFRVRRQKYI